MTKVKDSADRDRSRRDRSRNEEREKLTRRILRGLDLYSERGGEIQRLEEGLYRVPSGTPSGADRDPGGGRFARGPYTVCIQFARERCTCRYFKFWRVACKHIYAALVWEANHVRDLRVEEGPADVYGNRRYRLNEYRFGRFVRCRGERPNRMDCYLDKWDLESSASASPGPGDTQDPGVV